MKTQVLIGTIVFIIFLSMFPANAFADRPSPSESTSPNSQLDDGMHVLPMMNLEVAADASDIITFSEFPIGTIINTQYQNIGIIFGGDQPFISSDGANPTSPVLSGTPRFRGDIIGTFVEPGTDRPTVVESFTFDAGYFDELGSTRIEWFDPEGKKLGQRINSHLGIERFTISGGNIASWRISIVKTEPAGYAIDNFSFVPIGPSILFREHSGDTKDGTWGFQKDEIPGFDHSAFQMGNLVYECHPGYPSGTYVSDDGQESVSIVSVSGVQSQFTRDTFAHDSMTAGHTDVVDFEEIPVEEELAGKIRDAIESVLGWEFQYIDYSIDGLEATLSPAAQKGGDNSFTCVGLIEWAAEQAGHNGGEGFIRNIFESVTVPDPRTFPPESIEVPLLSPQLLNYAMKGQNLLQGVTQWIHGLFDPVDFIMIDTLGRRLGFVQGIGFLNEIPNAFYSGDGGVEQFLIPNPIPGTYTFELVGTDADVFAAVGTSGSSDSFNGFLPQGVTSVQQLFVEPKEGTGGDVDGDGDIDSDDIEALILRLNHFTDGLGDPGDLDGDGMLSDNDLTLLTELINLLEVTESVQYDLTISTTVGGNVTIPGEGVFTYEEGTVVDLVATPDAGYHFDNWTGNVSTIADVNDAATTITMEDDYDITANFEEIPEYGLTISSTEGGSVTTPGEGTFTYDEGTVINLVAEAEEGYYFVNWTGDVNTIADAEDAETTITMNDNYSITARFGPVCFIATAAYGTPMAEEIEILREFRDEYLLTNPLGRALVDVYYRVSPPMAEFITEHPSLKPIVRTGLVPVVVMSTIAVNTTPFEKTAIVGLLALVSVALAVWVTRRRRRGTEYARG